MKDKAVNSEKRGISCFASSLMPFRVVCVRTHAPCFDFFSYLQINSKGSEPWRLMRMTAKRKVALITIVTTTTIFRTWDD